MVHNICTSGPQRVKHVPHIVEPESFFGNPGNLWRHHGEAIGLLPSSSRFQPHYIPAYKKSLIILIFCKLHANYEKYTSETIIYPHKSDFSGYFKPKISFLRLREPRCNVFANWPIKCQLSMSST